MKWSETVASQCRYGAVIGPLFEGADVIWEDSTDGYSGEVDLVAFMPDGTFVHCEWSYGSCSGCDAWEGAKLTDDQIRAEVKASFGVCKTAQSALTYFARAAHMSEAEARIVCRSHAVRHWINHTAKAWGFPNDTK